MKNRSNNTFIRFVSTLMLTMTSLMAAHPVNAQNYCVPNVQMACFYGDKIVNVNFAGIDHSDDLCDDDEDGIKDFRSSVSPAQVTAGNSYTISVSVENNFSSGTERVRLWIDFDHDFVFEAAESFDLGVGTGNAVLSTTVAIPANAVTGTTAFRVMYRRTATNPLNAEDACHSYAPYRGQLKDYAITINGSSSCTSALQPGNTIATLSSACPGESFTLSLQNTVSGPAYQWQTSTDGTNWNNVPGATDETLTTSQVSPTWYRCEITCDGNTGTSNPLQVSSNGPVYTTLPVSESFETWSTMCGQATSVPGSFWLTMPNSGASSFRRNDQGTSAGWLNATTGMYAQAASNGIYSARFHTVENLAGVQGAMDLYVDCSTSGADKTLTFDYNNGSGTDVLQVLVSTDGGLNFSATGSTLTTTTGWQTHTFNIASVSATTIIRFKATSDGQLSDIGIDALHLESDVSCNAPLNTQAGSVTQTTAAVSWTAPVPAPSSGYEVVVALSDTEPTGAGAFYGSTSQNLFNLTPGATSYYFVRANCGGGLFSDWTMVSFTTLPASTTGIADLSEAQVSLFPNPATSLVSVLTTAGRTIEHLTIRSLTGELLSEQQPAEENAVFDIRSLSEGMYIVHLFTNDGRSSVQRLIVSR